MLSGWRCRTNSAATVPRERRGGKVGDGRRCALSLAHILPAVRGAYAIGRRSFTISAKTTQHGSLIFRIRQSSLPLGVISPRQRHNPRHAAHSPSAEGQRAPGGSLMSNRSRRFVGSSLRIWPTPCSSCSSSPAGVVAPKRESCTQAPPARRAPLKGRSPRAEKSREERVLVGRLHRERGQR